MVKKKKFNRKKKRKLEKRHLFIHKTPSNTPEKREPSQPIPKEKGLSSQDKNFSFIKKDLKVFLITSFAIILIIVIVYLFLAKTNLKIFNVTY